MQICNRIFSEAQVAAIMKHSLHGLAYLHAQKKIHRDVKSGNLLVDSQGKCKLGQFESGHGTEISAKERACDEADT